MASTFYESLTVEQHEAMSHSRECAGCARYLGKTEKGEHTYYWHYGASDGYVALPIKNENPHFGYESGFIWFYDGSGRERNFTTDGEEFTPPFQFLCHFDIRKLSEGALQELPNLNDGSYLPEDAARRVGVEAGVAIDWVGHLWLSPWELTKSLTDAALALTIVYPDRRKVVVL